MFVGFNFYILVVLIGVLGSMLGVVFNFLVVVIIFIIIVIVSRGVKESICFNNVIVLMKIGIILLFIIVGIGYVKLDNWFFFMLFGMKGVIVSVVIVFFVYLGFDVVFNVLEEVKNL